eukprot:5081465-Pyramimonas_sp.AAC.1
MPVVADIADVCAVAARNEPPLPRGPTTEPESLKGSVEEEKEKATEDAEEEISKEAIMEAEMSQVIPGATENFEEPGTSVLKRKIRR